MGCWSERLGNMLGEQGWLEAVASGEARQIIVWQILFLIILKILRAVRRLEFLFLLTMGEIRRSENEKVNSIWSFNNFLVC